MSILLETKQLTMRFGDFVAVQSVDMKVEEGQIHALIGPNGAGKTTLFNVISGLYRASEGSILLKGTDITKAKPYQAASYGISRTFQNLMLFENMSALDNVMVGRHRMMKRGLPSIILHTPSMKKDETACREKAESLLNFVGLQEHHYTNAGNLPYGKKRLLEIARSMASDPSLIMLDEPAAGMNPAETEELMELIFKIRDLGITVVLVEHDMQLVMNIADYITVLDHGIKIAEGIPSEIQTNPEVIRSYLGEDEEDEEDIDL